VILGAGFAGLQVAQQLINHDIEVVLIDRHSHHTFQPLLHQVATAELGPEQVNYPIRRLLRSALNARFVMAEILGIDAVAQWVQTSQGHIFYDYLVVATGSHPQLNQVTGASDHALPLKTTEQAIAIRQQVLRCFERAAATADPVEQSALLTFTIVGGGATGVEMAGALMDWIRHSLVKDYRMLPCSNIRLFLIHSRPQLLEGFHPKLQAYAQRHLKRTGVALKLQQRVHRLSAAGVTLASGELIASRTVIWATGVRGTYPAFRPALAKPAVAAWLQPSLNLAQFPQVYIAGDALGGLPSKAPWPQLAAVAVQQGNAIAHNILRTQRGQPPLPFRYRSRGSMAILGHHAAVMQWGAIRLTGLPAWFLWLAVHLLLLRGHSQRSSTLLHWLRSQYLRERSGQLAALTT